MEKGKFHRSARNSAASGKLWTLSITRTLLLLVQVTLTLDLYLGLDLYSRCGLYLKFYGIYSKYLQVVSIQ